LRDKADKADKAVLELMVVRWIASSLRSSQWRICLFILHLSILSVLSALS